MIDQEMQDLIADELNRVNNKLSEMGCDSVALFATVQIKGGLTRMMSAMNGNYWAQRGMLQGWLDNGSANDLAEKICSQSEEEED